MWWKTLLYSLIMIIGVAIGYILLIIPGIYLSIAWSFGFYLVIDKDMTPLDALQKSRELVHQVGFWKILRILTIIVGVLGMFTNNPCFGWSFVCTYVTPLYLCLSPQFMKMQLAALWFTQIKINHYTLNYIDDVGEQRLKLTPLMLLISS